MSRWSRLLLVAAALIHLSMLVSWRTGTLNPLFFDATVTHGHRGWDFYALYQAGHNVLTGHSVYESDGAKIDMVIPGGTYTPFRYLPVSAYTVGVLLNLVSPLWAYRLWVAFVELTLLGCAALTWRAIDDPNRRARITSMWLCFTPFYLELYMGQFSLVQGAMVLICLLLALRGRPGLPFDAAWIGSVLWKQNTALFVPVIIRLRRWRALIALALILGATTAPYMLLHPGALHAFLGNLRAEPPWFQMGNLGLRQWVFDAAWSIGDVLGTPLEQGAAVWIQRVVVLCGVGLPLALLALDPKPDPVSHLCLWMAAYFCVYHHVWEHHYVMLLPVLVVLSIRRESVWLWAIYVLLALPTPFVLIDPQGRVAVMDAMRWTPIRPLWQDLAYHASKALPALALYAGLAWQIGAGIGRRWRAGRFTLWPLIDRGAAS